MSHKKGTVWEAPPHTIAKIAMVRAYLYVWFSILGTTFARADLWYIDGFAGPGEYTNYPDGSPVAALKAAETATVDAGAKWVAGDVHCAFIEEDSKRFQHLQEMLAKREESPRVKRHLYQSTFVDGIDSIRKERPNPFQSRGPIFAFIDPFGARGLSFAVVRELLSRPTSEILVNLDADGIGRIYFGGDWANHRERLNEVFGDSEWEKELNGVRQENISSTVLAMYKRRLKAIPNCRYVFSFGMLAAGDRLDYHLVFASQHPRGLEKMKEQMTKIAGNGSYTFSDDLGGRQMLFRFDEPEYHAPDMARAFSGKTVPYAEVHDFALNESPFLNPKKMLAVLEANGQAFVQSNDPTRRKGTFPERLHTGMTIRFK